MNLKKNILESILKKVTGDKRFFCNNGMIFSDIFEFQKGLSEMTRETFSFHSNSEKNDFSNWIEGIFKDKSLASRIKKIKGPRKMSKVLDSYLSNPLSDLKSAHPEINSFNLENSKSKKIKFISEVFNNE